MGKLIGISTGLKNVDMAPGNIPCVVINSDFVKACNNYGNTAVIFGPQENLEMIDVSKFDAIVISGGGDINPNIYGEEKLEKTIRISELKNYSTDEKRDIYSTFDTEDQIDQGLPIDPFDLMNRLKQAGAMNNATTPSDALDAALNAFDQSEDENIPNE